MDPLTAILNLTTAMLSLAEKVVEKQPPEVSVELWKMYLEDAKEWRTFWKRFKINAT